CVQSVATAGDSSPTTGNLRHTCTTPAPSFLTRQRKQGAGAGIMIYMWPAFSLKLDDRWLPKSVICLRDYNLNKFLKDLVAGITVGLVALPLAMAFAIASGVTPQAGIYCAVVTGFLISALGGSKTQIGGPTGAFVVVVAGII